MWGSFPPYGAPAPAKQSGWLKWALLASVMVVVLTISGVGGVLAVEHWWVGLPVAVTTPSATLPTAPTATAPTATRTATGSSVGYSDFTDPLTSNVNGWPEDSYCSFRDGAYHVNPGTSYGGYLCYAPVGQFSDFDLHVTAQDVSGTLNSGYGLLFRATNAQNHYVFVVAALGAAWVDKIVNGLPYSVSPYWTPPTFVPGWGHPTTLRVVAHGSSFTCYVNGVEVGTVSDSTFTRGKVGVLSGVDAAFSNFEVAGVP
jgi:hypothetical protein